MNKHILWLGVALLVVVALLVPAAFAGDTNTNTQTKAWFEQMYAAKQANVEQAVKNGQLTPQQGEAWKKHFAEAQQLHAETGYFPAAGMANCRQGCGFGGGCRWNTQNQPQN